MRLRSGRISPEGVDELERQVWLAPISRSILARKRIRRLELRRDRAAPRRIPAGPPFESSISMAACASIAIDAIGTRKSRSVSISEAIVVARHVPVAGVWSGVAGSTRGAPSCLGDHSGSGSGSPMASSRRPHHRGYVRASLRRAAPDRVVAVRHPTMPADARSWRTPADPGGACPSRTAPACRLRR